MATDLPDIRAIKQAIQQLSRLEREELAEWILNSPAIGTSVAEPALAYGNQRVLTVEEYLELPEAMGRHEYVAGQIFAMNTPLVGHEAIVTNLLSHFSNQLRGGPCRALSSNIAIRMRIDQNDIFYLPDVSIHCEAFTAELRQQQFLTHPRVIVEVLSASTERIDRQEKALNYRRIPALEEYLLVAQRTMEVTIHRRSENWAPTILKAPLDVYQSRAVEVSITLAEIYEGFAWD
jgi:Uma2 family endonuclease